MKRMLTFLILNKILGEKLEKQILAEPGQLWLHLESESLQLEDPERRQVLKNLTTSLRRGQSWPEVCCIQDRIMLHSQFRHSCSASCQMDVKELNEDEEKNF